MISNQAYDPKFFPSFKRVVADLRTIDPNFQHDKLIKNVCCLLIYVFLEVQFWIFALVPFLC